LGDELELGVKLGLGHLVRVRTAEFGPDQRKLAGLGGQQP